MSAHTLKVVSDDGNVNASDETWAAWKGKPVPRQTSWLARDFEDGGGGFSPFRVPKRGGPTTPRQAAEVLTRKEVDDLLADRRHWSLLVRHNKQEVLDREKVEEAWDKGYKEVRLRNPTDEELDLVKLFEAEAPVASRLSGIEPLWAAAVSVIGLIPTGLGLFTENVKIAHDWLAYAAVLLFIVSLTIALVVRFARKNVLIKRARLDLLAQGLKPTRAQRWLPGVLIAVVLLTVVTGFGAVILPNDDAEQSAEFSSPTTSERADGRTTVTLTVTWKNLPPEVKKVRTTVSTAEAALVTKTSNKVAGDSTIHEVEADLAGPGTIKVSTTALDAAGATVGNEESRSFDIP